MTEITDEEIAELERLGTDTWTVGRGAYHSITVEAPGRRYPVIDGVLSEDADTIVGAHNNLPKLLSSLKALKVENEELRSAVVVIQCDSPQHEHECNHEDCIEELERVRDLCVALESHIAMVAEELLEAGVPHNQGSFRFIPSELESDIHPGGVPQ